MKKLKSLLNPVTLGAVILFIALIIIKPDICTAGAARGLVLSGKVIVPSFFPFTMCVLFIVKSGTLDKFSILNSFTKKVFHLTPEQFAVMLLSMIGGYPIGAQLINALYLSHKISKNNARLMLNYCVNAGPAFIVLAVGSGMLASKQIGYVLLISHLAASIILSLALKGFIKPEEIPPNKTKPLNAADNFVISTSEAASGVFSICGYIILFSTIYSYIEYFAAKITALKYVGYILEVTTAVSFTKNILLISFLLGFAGISVWFQVLAVTRDFKMNVPLFITSRVFHGLLGVCITSVLMKVFNIALPAISNGKIFSGEISYTTLTLSLSLVCMVIVLLISLSTKKYSGKFYSDLV